VRVAAQISCHGASVNATTPLCYTDFARQLQATGILSDAWIDGVPRFRLQGMVLSSGQARALRLAAERIGAVYQELIDLVWEQPQWLDTYFRLTPYQKLMWFAAQGRWHGMARADLFLCADGRIQCCEVNSDTPSGEAEAVLVNRLLRPYHRAVRDPNQRLPAAFWRMLVASHGGRKPRRVGIVYPTEISEDLSMIALYQQWLQAHGCRVILGSPYNLHPGNGGVGMFGEPVDLIIRHYKTDWWGEREVVWYDAPPYPDAAPLTAPLRLLLEAEYSGKVTVVNPFGAVVSQNKLSLALMWEEQQRFSPRARRWIRRYIPETYRLTQIPAAQLVRQREAWVLKSAYGCEGEETVCGPFVSEAQWRETVASVLPEFWVCQRFFAVAPEACGALANYGVYLVGGRSAGFYTRLSVAATDAHSMTAPTFIARGESSWDSQDDPHIGGRR
jgi:glutathionylspermidine synthase